MGISDNFRKSESQKNEMSFPLIFQVILQTKILESVNAVSTMLQATNTDMQKALTLPDNTIQSLSEYRGAFDQAKIKAQTLAEKWGSQTTFENVRVRRMKYHYGAIPRKTVTSITPTKYHGIVLVLWM